MKWTYMILILGSVCSASYAESKFTPNPAKQQQLSQKLAAMFQKVKIGSRSVRTKTYSDAEALSTLNKQLPRNYRASSFSSSSQVTALYGQNVSDIFPVVSKVCKSANPNDPGAQQACIDSINQKAFDMGVIAGGGGTFKFIAFPINAANGLVQGEGLFISSPYFIGIGVIGTYGGVPGAAYAACDIWNGCYADAG